MSESCSLCDPVASSFGGCSLLSDLTLALTSFAGGFDVTKIYRRKRIARKPLTLLSVKLDRGAKNPSTACSACMLLTVKWISICDNRWRARDMLVRLRMGIVSGKHRDANARFDDVGVPNNKG